MLTVAGAAPVRTIKIVQPPGDALRPLEKIWDFAWLMKVPPSPQLAEFEVNQLEADEVKLGRRPRGGWARLGCANDDNYLL